MGSYEPFLISDMRTGLELARAPWLLPRDAFSSMENVFLRDGVLQKREGYAEFADTGAGYPIVGIMNRTQTDGSRQLCVADTKRLYRYTGSALSDVDGADAWTGTARNLIHWADWKTVLYMANGQDRLRQYDGSSASWMDIDTNGDAANDVTSCRFVAVFKERLVVFRTVEGGTYQPQRARWCVAGDPTDWRESEGGGYADAPTGQIIRGVGALVDALVVWFDGSVWLFKYTADSDAPFRWEKVSDEYGCVAPMSVVGLLGKSIALGRAGFVACDGFSVARMDEKIPDYAAAFRPELADLAYGAVVADKRQILMLYPSASSDYPDKALAYNWEDGSWAVFDMPMNCMGQYFDDDVLSWEDASGTWASHSEAWITQAGKFGYPDTLAGDNSGKVYTLNSGEDDDGSDIAAEVVTARWNPYGKDGLKARLGYVDFLVESDADVSLSVEFFLDWKGTAYQTKTLSFDLDNEKAWARVFSGATGASHRLKLSHTDNQAFKIHAIMPWFKPAGRAA